MKNIALIFVIAYILLTNCKAIEEITRINGPLSSSQISIINIHFNEVNDGITIVDWEGPVRNPYIEYKIKGSDSINYPITVNFETIDGRTYFNPPSELSSSSASKTIQLNSAEDTVPIKLSFFPDEDYENDTLELVLSYNANGNNFNETVPIYVIDQDYDRDFSYPVTVDYSEGVDAMFTDPELRKVVNSAAEHWVYYLDGERLNEIPKNEASIIIGGNGHPFDEKSISNSFAYKGFYLFVYDAISTDPCICSTGFPSQFWKLQNDGEYPVPIMGAYALNVQGNFNTSGYSIESPYENWTQQDVYPKTDLYSLALHEIGHSITYEFLPKYVEAIDRGYFESPNLTEYYGGNVPIIAESPTHIIEVVDPASGQKPFGGNIDAFIPGGRELITKLDLLIMESVGYPIRENEVTKAMSLDFEGGRLGSVNKLFNLIIKPSGGIPIYDFRIIEGQLPNGLTLNSQTGLISGIPTKMESQLITVGIRDYSLIYQLEHSIEIIIQDNDLNEVISSLQK